jgi:hypothetical protein
MPVAPVPVKTQARMNLTEALRSMKVADTLRFPLGTNYGSIRTLATSLRIKVIMRQLDTGEIEVTRRL